MKIIIWGGGIFKGDARRILATIPDKSVDMIFTSPPYADRRKNTYGGTCEHKYVNWFLPIATEIKRTMKPSASFFLNIKPHTHNGERSLYVFDLILALIRETGFKLIDEFSWIKSPFPGAYIGRFKNAFEPVYHFAISKPGDICFNPDACATPIKPESIKRGLRKVSRKPANGSGMTGHNSDLCRLTTSRPSNVIRINNISNQHGYKKLHPATFPEGLPAFFIKSFTNHGAMVLDPFAGSGTTGRMAHCLGRRYILIDRKQQYINLMRSWEASLQ